MKKVSLLLISLLVLTSCEIYKKALVNDQSKKSVITERQITTRKSDSVSIVVPNVVLKDTVIERINYKDRTIARVTYDKNGNGRFDCLPAEIQELKELIHEKIDNDIKTKNKTESSFNPQYVFYGIAAILLLGALFLGVLYLMIGKLQKSIPQALFELTKNKLNE